MTGDELSRLYGTIRSATNRLCQPLEIEDYVVQTMPDVSPTKWHLAHTSWFFETFVLRAASGSYEPFGDGYEELFNSYYNTIGQPHPRPQRGHLTRPTVAEIYRYREHVDAAMQRLLGDRSGGLDPELAFAVELGLNHEEQHQELVLTDIKHVLAANSPPTAYLDGSRRNGPLASGAARTGPPRDRPVREIQPRPDPPVASPSLHARERGGPGGDGRGGSVVTVAWRTFAGGLVVVGRSGDGFAFDNERPRHSVYVRPFDLADRLVTCGEFLDFVRDEGYDRPDLWLSDGWDARRRHGWQAPLYWQFEPGRAGSEARGRVVLFTLAGPREIDPLEPVCHVSYYEADAYARWAGARLPLEEEWEVVSTSSAVSRGAGTGGERASEDSGSAAPGRDAERVPDGNFLESGILHPAPASFDGRDAIAADPPRSGRGRPEPGVLQMFGDVWEWTSSPYVPYPGFRPFEGALGEYNGKFMCNQMVLRGGSCATPRRHIRPTYRNFFPPDARWQFTGLRLARS